ncbi:Zn-ribbon domain-containing OB-fold protein [Streptomyces sp. NPDC018031]|uniref:Zn-ribbon domain-containing OB-fold protein n=1 Tax=Streptomyces sp. NPDC018031 TaxID=3365033 RepID=UPI00378DDE86
MPDEDAAPFWAYSARGELRIQRCSGCGASRFPPGPCCPSCQSFRSHWRRTSGRGRIWSYVVAHPPPVTGDAAPGPRHLVHPVHLVLVELPDTPGVRLAGDLVPAAGAAPDPAGPPDPVGLCVGAPVRVVFRVTAGGVTVPCWLLEPPGGGGPGTGRPRGRPERSPLPGRAGRDVS